MGSILSAFPGDPGALAVYFILLGFLKKQRAPRGALVLEYYGVYCARYCVSEASTLPSDQAPRVLACFTAASTSPIEALRLMVNT